MIIRSQLFFHLPYVGALVAFRKQSANSVAASWSLHEMIVSDKGKWVSKLYNTYKLFTRGSKDGVLEHLAFCKYSQM
jgi:hypothetical protein